VRESILQQQVINREPMMLPEPAGPVVSLSEKLFIPVKEHPEVHRARSYRHFDSSFNSLIQRYLLMRYSFGEIPVLHVL